MTVTDLRPEVHPLIQERWSPRAFATTPLSDEQVELLLEAARWAPSAMNAQPWRFLVGRVGEDGPDATHAGIHETLAAGNQAWAGDAPLLVAAVARVQETDGTERAVGRYELGLAVAQLTFQAHALGLHVHQMGGFSRPALRTRFGIPEDYAPVAVLAVGPVGDPARLPDALREREGAERTRLPHAELAYAGTWGTPALAS